MYWHTKRKRPLNDHSCVCPMNCACTVVLKFRNPSIARHQAKWNHFPVRTDCQLHVQFYNTAKPDSREWNNCNHGGWVSTFFKRLHWHGRPGCRQHCVCVMGPTCYAQDSMNCRTSSCTLTCSLVKCEGLQFEDLLHAVAFSERCHPVFIISTWRQVNRKTSVVGELSVTTTVEPHSKWRLVHLLDCHFNIEVNVGLIWLHTVDTVENYSSQIWMSIW